MKDKIIIFIIGVLVGAVIATGVFYIYTTTNSNKNTESTQIYGGQPPKMPSGEMGEPPEKPNGEMGEPPEKPSGEMSEPPEKPSENSTQTNS